jgi:hypothetical protein
MAEVPDRIKRTVTIALDSLRKIESALRQGRSCDEQFGGDGRYEWEVWTQIYDRDTRIESSLEILKEFRARAKAIGLDPEVTITELGGVPNWKPSPAIEKWDRPPTQRTAKPNLGVTP